MQVPEDIQHAFDQAFGPGRDLPRHQEQQVDSPNTAPFHRGRSRRRPGWRNVRPRSDWGSGEGDACATSETPSRRCRLSKGNRPAPLCARSIGLSPKAFGNRRAPAPHSLPQNLDRPWPDGTGSASSAADRMASNTAARVENLNRRQAKFGICIVDIRRADRLRSRRRQSFLGPGQSRSPGCFWICATASPRSFVPLRKKRNGPLTPAKPCALCQRPRSKRVGVALGDQCADGGDPVIGKPRNRARRGAVSRLITRVELGLNQRG